MPFFLKIAKIIISAATFVTLALCGTAAAQSRLPACPTSQSIRFHNCYGSYVWANGEKYVGEWRDDKRSGEGIQYSPNGSIRQMGLWANGQFVQKIEVIPSTPPPPRSHSPVGPASPTPQALPRLSSGSAFRIAPGQFVTNHHVIEGCIALKVGTHSGAQVVISDPVKDLALINVPNDGGPTASIRSTRIQLNETITIAGFPLAMVLPGIAITSGTISRLSGLRGDTGVLQISAPVQPGNSGGPLLDTAGNVIGVVSSKLNALKMLGLSGDIPENVNFAINGAVLRTFLDAASIDYNEVGNEVELTGTQIAARSREFTAFVECKREVKEAQIDAPKTPPSTPDIAVQPQPPKSASVSPDAEKTNPVVPGNVPDRDKVKTDPVPKYKIKGGFAVQLSAALTLEEARESIKKYKNQFRATLKGFQLLVIKGYSGEGEVYRIGSEGLSRERALEVCTNIKGAGGSCFVAAN